MYIVGPLKAYTGLLYPTFKGTVSTTCYFRQHAIFSNTENRPTDRQTDRPTDRQING